MFDNIIAFYRVRGDHRHRGGAHNWAQSRSTVAVMIKVDNAAKGIIGTRIDGESANEAQEWLQKARDIQDRLGTFLR